jgi:small subunit ribosomal protein S3
VEIAREGPDIAVTLHSARPGIIIGRGGQRAEELRKELANSVGQKIHLTVREVGNPQLEAILVARSIAEQIVRRVTVRRAMKQAMFRVMQAGARGVKIACAGRLGGAEIARRQSIHQGQLPLHTIRANIDYGFTEAHTLMGQVGVKVWVYKGDIVPEKIGRDSVTAETGQVSESAQR